MAGAGTGFRCPPPARRSSPASEPSPCVPASLCLPASASASVSLRVWFCLCLWACFLAVSMCLSHSVSPFFFFNLRCSPPPSLRPSFPSSLSGSPPLSLPPSLSPKSCLSLLPLPVYLPHSGTSSCRSPGSSRLLPLPGRGLFSSCGITKPSAASASLISAPSHVLLGTAGPICAEASSEMREEGTHDLTKPYRKDRVPPLPRTPWVVLKCKGIS